MPFNKDVHYTCQCDECDYDSTITGGTKQEAIKEFKEDGWTFKDKVLCSECSRKLKKEKRA